MAKESWTAEDTASIAKDLRKPTWKKLIANLQNGAPKIKGIKFEEVALEAKEKTGWDNCIASLLANGQEGTKDVQFNTFVDTDN